jgi:hypothetical protein
MDAFRKIIRIVSEIGALFGASLVVFKVVAHILDMIGYIQTVQQVAGWIPWEWINESAWWIAPVVCAVCLILIFTIGRRMPGEKKKNNGLIQPLVSGQLAPPPIHNPRIDRVVSEALVLLRDPKLHPFEPLNALREAGAASLQSDEIVEVSNEIVARNYEQPFPEPITPSNYLAFLKFSVEWHLPLGTKSEIYEATKQFYLHGKPNISPNKAPIEVTDELISEGETLEELCSGYPNGADALKRVNAWIEKTRMQLRSGAPDYVATFNDSIKDPRPSSWIPGRDGGRTVPQLAKWWADEDRRKAWKLISESLVRLKDIRGRMRAKLPL